jgi:CRP-like cAMP-binding protein
VNVVHQCSNRIISSLSEEARSYLLERCQNVVLEQRATIYEEEQTQQYAYFLDSGFASIVVSMHDGETAEVEMVGREGVVGGFNLLSRANVPVPTRCFIQVAAEGHRIPMPELRRVVQTMPEIRERISAFLQAEMAALTQVAACHRVHEAEQRLSRWLLMAQDRVGGDVLRLTQEFLAEMLGTRRTTVTEVAGGLQRKGLIEYHRGTVKVVNRPELEGVSCGCYRIVTRIYESIYTRDKVALDGHAK